MRAACLAVFTTLLGILQPALAGAPPEPEGYRDYLVRPAPAQYDPSLREFVLPYEAVRRASNPDRALLEFCQSCYEAAAECGKWDRAALERVPDA